MLDGWILELGDNCDAIHVEFVQAYSGMFFLVFT